MSGFFKEEIDFFIFYSTLIFSVTITIYGNKDL